MQVLFHADEIAKTVARLGDEISSRFKGNCLHVIGILKGGCIFAADLVRQIDLPVEMDFARLSSYAGGVDPGEGVELIMDIETPLKDKHVLIVDDILDTGQSMHIFRAHLQRMAPASVSVCTLIDKTCRRTADISPDFYGFRIEDGFVVGYGLDFAELYRSLPDIYLLNSENGR